MVEKEKKSKKTCSFIREFRVKMAKSHFLVIQWKYDMSLSGPQFVPFQETFKVTVLNFDTIVDKGEGLNQIMGHFTSIECKQSA